MRAVRVAAGGGVELAEVAQPDAAVAPVEGVEGSRHLVEADVTGVHGDAPGLAQVPLSTRSPASARNLIPAALRTERHRGRLPGPEKGPRRRASRLWVPRVLDG